jgi:rubredoxin
MIHGIIGHKGTNRAKVECDICATTTEVTCRYVKNGRGGAPDEGQAISKARGMGWTNLGGRLRCPSCEAKRKAAHRAMETLPPESLPVVFAPLAKPIEVPLDDLASGSIAYNPAVPSLRPKMPDADTSPTRIKLTAAQERQEARRALIRQHSAAGVTDIMTMAKLVKADRTTVGDDMNAMRLPVTKRAKGRYPDKPNQTIAKETPKPTEPKMTKTDTDFQPITLPKAGASTEPLRQPTVAQRRAIRDLLDTVYDEPGQRYTAGETDFTVAAALEGGIMPGWVAEVREAFYGPAGNADLEKLIDAMATLEAKAAADGRELAALGGDLDRLQRAHAATQNSIADLRTQVARLKAALGPKGARL